MLQAFGHFARQWAARLPTDIPALLVDPSDSAEAGHAMANAMRRRSSGEDFAIGIATMHARSFFANVAAHHVLKFDASPDGRLINMEQLANDVLLMNGSKVSVISGLGEQHLRFSRDILQAAAVLLVQSHAEHGWLAPMIGFDRPYLAVAPALDPLVPNAFGRPDGKTIVVWAPELDAQQCAVIVFALDELLDDVVVVCASGDLPNVKARFVRLQDAGAALADACVVVDATANTPGAAIALARAANAGLAVATTSGGTEYLDGVARYTPWNARSITEAVTVARSLRARERAALPDVTREINRAIDAQRPIVESAPLVSIVVPTYNRRTSLRRTLVALSRQTYPNVEIVVVNDAGENVDDIVAEFALARLIIREANGGPTRAVNTGIAAARGEYVMVCADDDELFPDHLARVIPPLERTGRDVAQSHAMLRCDQRRPDGGREAYGYSANYSEGLDRSVALCRNPFNLTGWPIRRSATWPDLFDAGMGNICDWDLALKLAEKHEVVHVDALTVQSSVVSDGKNAMFKESLLTDVQALYARYPVPGRPIIQARRDQSYQINIVMVRDQTFVEPSVRIDPPVEIDPPLAALGQLENA